MLIRVYCSIFAGIDGYSSNLKCSDNTASTVLRLFIQATREHGFPSRVRSDYGMKNIEVARLMIQQRGTEVVISPVGPFITNGLRGCGGK